MADSSVPADRPFVPRVRHHLSDLLRLAWPVMLSRAGILVMAFTDMAMLGRYEPGAVGIINLGLAVFIPCLVVTIGLMTGLVPVVSRAYGAGDVRECGRAWRRGLVWGLVLSVIAAWVTAQGETWLGLFGQTPAMAAAGGDVAVALAPGLVAQVMFAISAFYLEATRRPYSALIVMVGANIANVFFNWLLIYGSWGFPELGPVGAALASSIVRFGAAGAMILIVLLQPRAEEAGVRGSWDTFWGPGGWRAGAQMRKLGVSAGLGNGFETIGFSFMMLIAGTLGPLALDSYAIAHNLVSTLFMVGLGLSIATGVRVGIEIGREDPREAAFAGWVGLGAAVGIMSILGLLVYLGREVIPAVYTDVPEIQARVATLLIFAAIVFVPDTSQVVMGQAVRALGDAWVPIACYTLAFLVVLVPLGWALVVLVGFDERGLLAAISIACLLATVLLAARFRVLTLRAQP